MENSAAKPVGATVPNVSQSAVSGQLVSQLEKQNVPGSGSAQTVQNISEGKRFVFNPLLAPNVYSALQRNIQFVTDNQQ